jgi:NDP-sugar pyrophosphorylase family protein
MVGAPSITPHPPITVHQSPITPLMIRTAFVLGAGLGTRLRPLTDRRPKPLIPLVNRPLITYAFDHLLGAGAERFVVNTHWRAEAYDAAFPDRTYRGAPITLRHESPQVLETGGGIKNAEDLLHGGPFWVYNGDILSTLPLEPALRAHHDAGNEVTLVLRSKGDVLNVAFEHGRVVDLRNTFGRGGGFLFTGICLVKPAFLARIPPDTVISIVPIFCDMIRAGAKLGGVVIDDGAWWDLGSPEQYLAAHEALRNSEFGIGSSEWIAADAQVAPEAEITGATAIGRGARVGARARLHDCVVWDGVEVPPGTVRERCIFHEGGVLQVP